VEAAQKHFSPFSSSEVTAIDLLYQLRKRNMPLGAYEDIMQWHFNAIRRNRHVTYVGNDCPISREKLLKKLFKRYNMEGLVNCSCQITLPSSGAKVKIMTNSMEWCLQSLLTDPSIADDDYLFHNNDPFCPPPEESLVVGDINTGQAYCESYQKYIKIPGKQVLLPVIFYIDGTATAQFSDLPVTALKFTLGIFNRKARDRPQMWRILGYVPNFSKEKSHGRRQFYNSGHIESANLGLSMSHDEGNVGDNDVVPAQDLHTILAKILEPYIHIQESGGFEWDLSYQGKVHRGIQFIPYVHMIKCDTDEADRLAGSYTSRGKNVSQLCRYCVCPTTKSDDPHAQYGRKTVPMIQRLIDKKDLASLKSLSQHCITNAWYPVRFGAHNKEGIHGSCPFEMLHALLLGIFKYVRDCFFEQIGRSSRAGEAIIALGDNYGDLFTRQSDRDMPVTKFSSGIQHNGMMTAKKYSGILLVMAAILQSTKGSELVTGISGSTFATNNGLGDWIMLVETLLMWETWLKSDEISKHHVHRADKKHRFIMYLIRKVANRQAGMGLKIVKFHAIVHMAEDIIKFGVPMNFDTGSDESGHKATKTAAVVTQKRKERFDEQVGRRLSEVHALQLAHEEIKHGRCPWKYHQVYRPKSTTTTNEVGNTPPFGSSFAIHVGVNGAKTLRKFGKTLSGMDNVPIEESYVNFVVQLTEMVRPHVPNLVVYSTIRRNGVLYRGTPWYDGGIWRDWVIVNWGEHGQLPNKIWGFVNLSAIPPDNDLNCGGLHPIPPAVYAIVESAEPDRSKSVANSEIFIPLLLEVGQMRHNRVTKLQFYLADVEAFSEPVVVIPDIGGAANRYLQLKNRNTWREDFAAWLDMEHEPIPQFDD
jgi:hypothetical protein